MPRDEATYPLRENAVLATDEENDALWWAANNGDTKLVELALKRGCELRRDVFKVVKGDPYANLRYTRDWTEPVYEYFQQANQEKYLSSALHRAAMFGHEEICTILINAGWNPALLDKDQFSPSDDAYAAGNVDLSLYIRAQAVKQSKRHK